eukprot:TRINITY_DN5984_c0_g3_i5.p1 TRINITY_DN5984_c0_g3~~TRINITY_DN5984_c0_g3_i5.p1  ORF type:complete len:193 (+),score=14.31 TRINITY_DN5984_c0_g3_i5:142-720(+)
MCIRDSQKYFPNLQPPQTSSHAEYEHTKPPSGSHNYANSYFKKNFFSSPDQPSRRARAVSPVRSSQNAHSLPSQSENASSQQHYSQTNPSPSVDPEYDVYSSTPHSYHQANSSADPRRQHSYSSVSGQPSAPQSCSGLNQSPPQMCSGLNQSPRHLTEISSDSLERSDSDNFIIQEFSDEDSSFHSCRSPSH